MYWLIASALNNITCPNSSYRRNVSFLVFDRHPKSKFRQHEEETRLIEKDKILYWIGVFDFVGLNCIRLPGGWMDGWINPQDWSERIVRNELLEYIYQLQHRYIRTSMKCNVKSAKFRIAITNWNRKLCFIWNRFRDSRLSDAEHVISLFYSLRYAQGLLCSRIYIPPWRLAKPGDLDCTYLDVYVGRSFYELTQRGWREKTIVLSN